MHRPGSPVLLAGSQSQRDTLGSSMPAKLREGGRAHAGFVMVASAPANVTRLQQRWTRILMRYAQLRGPRTSSASSPEAQTGLWVCGRTAGECMRLWRKPGAAHHTEVTRFGKILQLMLKSLLGAEHQLFPRAESRSRNLATSSGGLVAMASQADFSLLAICKAVLGANSQSPVRDATWSPDSQLILAGSLDGSARVWQTLG